MTYKCSPVIILCWATFSRPLNALDSTYTEYIEPHPPKPLWFFILQYSLKPMHGDHDNLLFHIIPLKHSLHLRRRAARRHDRHRYRFLSRLATLSGIYTSQYKFHFTWFLRRVELQKEGAAGRRAVEWFPESGAAITPRLRTEDLRNGCRNVSQLGYQQLVIAQNQKVLQKRTFFELRRLTIKL